MKYEKDWMRKNEKNKNKLIKHASEIKEDLLKSYESDYASLLLPTEKKFIKKVAEILKTKKEYKHLIVIGIGGSNLGTQAIIEAIHGKDHLINKNKKIFFADTTDPDNITSIKKQVKNKKFLVLLISKSGTTTESLANFEVILKEIPKQERTKRIITITDKNTELEKYSNKKGYLCLEIPKKVGGRYSVLSYVGLVPLAFAEIKIKNLLKGASDAIKNFDKNNIAMEGALDLFHNYENNKKINDIFLFNNDLESLGKWYRQLMGESIGKKYTKTKKQAHIGITPTVSIGSTDLHSVGQLYMGGPKDKFTTFISLEKQTKVIIPKNEDAILKNIQGLSFKRILQAIMQGTMTAYKKNKLPYNHYTLKEKTEYELGYFMQTKMLEIILLAHLLNVNPFDQPSVEEYKKETRKLLKT